MRSKAETELSKSIRDALDAHRVWWVRVQCGTVELKNGSWMHLAEPGTPDLYLPAFGWLEIKTGGGKLRPEQIAWHSRAAQHGIKVAIVRSVRDAIEIVHAWKSEREHSKQMGWDAR